MSVVWVVVVYERSGPERESGLRELRIAGSEEIIAAAYQTQRYARGHMRRGKPAATIENYGRAVPCLPEPCDRDLSAPGTCAHSGRAAPIPHGGANVGQHDVVGESTQVSHARSR